MKIIARILSNIALLYILILSNSVLSQGRVIINNNGHITLANGIFLVIGSGNSNAITKIGTGGSIISEDEDNIVRWNIGSSIATYTVPFSTVAPAMTDIPVEFEVSVAGVGTGKIDFSTYPTVTGSTNVPYPSDVTCLELQTVCFTTGISQHEYAVDRFWKVDARDYTTRPSAIMQFVFLNSETVNNNSINIGSLQAQRFESANDDWSGFNSGIASTGGVTSSVSNIVVPSNQLFNSWTLTDLLTPLPIELSEFYVNCQGNTSILNWTTLSEFNNDYFEIESSSDGFQFTSIGMLGSVGNSTQTIHYSFEDPFARNVQYYRLKQVDVNGVYTYTDIILSNCTKMHNSMRIYPNPTNGTLNIEVPENSNGIISISSAVGNVIKTISLTDQSTIQVDLSTYSTGVYFITWMTGGEIITERVVKR